jgi:hypothetical protein
VESIPARVHGAPEEAWSAGAFPSWQEFLCATSVFSCASVVNFLLQTTTEDAASAQRRI